MDIPKKLLDLAVSDSGFVFDPHTGATFSTNPTGLSILNALRAGKDRASVREALEELFDVEGADLERDLDEFVRMLKHHDILPDDARI